VPMFLFLLKVTNIDETFHVFISHFSQIRYSGKSQTYIYIPKCNLKMDSLINNRE